MRLVVLPIAVSEGVGGAIAGGLTALVAGAVGIATERFKQDRERMKVREEGFERAQTGYRACYEKFLNTVARCLNEQEDGEPKPNDLGELYRNFDEACLAGDPLVVEKLLAYWPLERRDRREPPEHMPTPELVKAMAEHGYRSVTAQDELKKVKTTPTAS